MSPENLEKAFASDSVVSNRILNAFLNACKEMQVYILVRYTNHESLRYVGQPGFMSKPISCKAKTAQHDYNGYKLAGLVVNLDVFGKNSDTPLPMFDSDKWVSASREFKKMKEAGLVRGSEAESKKPNLASVSNRKLSPYEVQRNALYTTDLDKGSKHYGCMQYMGQYLHGDFDLFDIVNAKDPLDNRRVERQLLGEVNWCNKHFPGVFSKVNGGSGLRIVQHGAQAQFINAAERNVRLFSPTGETFVFQTDQELRHYYKNQFRGRKLWTSNGLADMA